MTETTVPRVAKFADIKVGQTVERVCTLPSGSTFTRVGVVREVAEHAARDSAGIWLAGAGDDDNPHLTLRILSDPTPQLPTAPGTVIRIGDNVWLLDDNGDWYCSLIEDPGPRPEDATDWEVIHDPNAPDEDPADENAWMGMCGARNPDSYICTLDADHTGPHVAMGGSMARATWRDEPPTADPLDENDHRDRVDKHGLRITRHGNKHWHTPAIRGTWCGHCEGNSLADWNAAVGPLRFADEVTA